MNIFVLDEDPMLAAQMHVDRHVVKMTQESADMLTCALKTHGVDYGTNIDPARWRHRNHPCTKWAMETRANFRWLHCLALCLCREYEYRYGRPGKEQHAYYEIIRAMPEPDIAYLDLTPHARACGPHWNEYYGSDVETYRLYYQFEKSHLHRYTRRPPPKWLEGIWSYTTTRGHMVWIGNGQNSNTSNQRSVG